MTNRVPLEISNLDFDGIKSSLKDYLKNRNSPIKDYNYEGSAFNILLDVLAANSHYQSLYQNFIANEMFLDSALLRSSVVSIAKELGYVPRSSRASTATIKIEMPTFIDGEFSIFVPRGTKFETSIDNVTYAYYNLNDEFLRWDNTAYVGEFTVHCGRILSQTETYQEGTRMFLNADHVDISTLSVLVQESLFDTTQTMYSDFINIIDLSDTSRIYFLAETNRNRYEIKFGDDVIGRKLQTGNVVTFKYLSATQDVPYGAKVFVADSSFMTGYPRTITAVVAGSGSTGVEDVDSMRKNIQRFNQAQNRSVVPSDYVHHILQDYPDALDVIVWGGEDNIPPVYGKVFASCVLKGYSIIPDKKKSEIASIIKRRNMINVRPEVIDPEYFNVHISGYVRYKQSELSVSSSDLKTLILSTMENFSVQQLERFNQNLSYSKLSNAIDIIDPAITSVVLKFSLNTRVRLNLNGFNVFSKKFNNPIRVGTFRTERYFIGEDRVYQYDIRDVNGELHEFAYEYGDESKKTFVRRMGSISYINGKIEISDLQCLPVTGAEELNLYAGIDSSEIMTGFNQILRLNVISSAPHIEIRSS